MFRSATTILVLAAASGLARQVEASEPVAARRPVESELARAPSWVQPRLEDVQARLTEALASLPPGPEADADRQAELAAAWTAAAAGRRDRLDVALGAIAAREPRAAALLEAVEREGDPEAAWLADPQAGTFIRDALRLWLGREFVRQGRFDEALALLRNLEVETAIDPAGLLFHRGCCEHWMLERERAIESFDRLLEREDEIPVRYARLARLLRADIAAVEPDSLDHIARRIRDVRRRLDLGQAGPAIRGVQDGVIESLDKLIEEAERQRQQQGQAGGGAGGSGSGQGGDLQPMEDSRIAGGRGPGEVRKKELGTGDGWGNLPPQQREAALQQIGREFPPHYREAIEQYFKRLATGEDRAP
jgi:tetratricopeptide (TPR) repeat protein